MEAAVPPRRSQSPESEEWDPVERSIVEMVNKRRMKVQSLERELDILRTHMTKLFGNFSVPTFPEGYDPGADRSGDDYVNDSIPSASAAARGLKKRQSPSSKNKREVGFANGGHITEDAVPTVSVRDRMHPKTLSSSKPPSSSKEPSDSVDLTVEKDTRVMKDEIRKTRSGGKSPKKSPAKATEISTSATSGKGSSNDSSDEEESPIESPDKEVLRESSKELGSEPSGEESSGNEESESASEDSDDSESNPEIEIKEAGSGPGSDPEVVSADGIPSSRTSDILIENKSSPVKVMRKLSAEKPKTTWQPKSKAPSSSEDSEEDSSSSDHDTARNRHQSQSGRASLGQARKQEVPKAVSTLPSDASPEDLFDWLILGLQGPWPSLVSVETGSETLVVKDESLPLKFPSMAVYTTAFQNLIREEAKAILSTEWESFKAEKESNNKLEQTVDSRGQSLVWHMRSMVRTMGDEFHYFEAECKQGNIKLDVGEFLCMVVPGTEEIKAVAIVNYQDRLRAPLLRTRAPWDFSLGECVLLRLCNMVTLRRMFLAVSTLSKIFGPLRQQILDPLANIKFLKPSPALEDSEGGDQMPKLSFESLRNFSDRKILNTLQLLSVSTLLHLRQGFQLVQGPPGTGKTSTIVGMVSALLIEEPGVRILVCTPSNAALDEIAARLMRGMWDKSGNTYSPIDGSLVRFGSPRAIHPVVQFISLDSLTVRLSSSSSRLRAWVDILDGASVVCATLSGCGSHTFDELKKKFDVVVIDEAAQAVEAEVLIALKRVKGRCVMVGDPQQLPATVFQRPSVAYGRSLFERFQAGGNPVHMLTTQYRMHPSICYYPSKQFYGGALTNSSRTSTMRSIFSEEVCRKGITVRGCRFKLGHYCFMDVGWGTEHEELVGHSRANFEEALVVSNVVEGAVKGLLPGRKPNVGVITPYIAQRGAIESQLERRGINTEACEVNTVDGFQGREKDVIVLSCVRAMADRGLGFVSDEKRINVALTRAKYSLIIVGHAMTLRKWSPTWNALIDDARKRGWYQVLQNNKNQNVPPSNWDRSFIPRNELNDSLVENTPQGSRKRSSNGTEGSRPNKKEYLKPTTIEPKSNKDVQDSVEARRDEEHTQLFSRKDRTGGVEEKTREKRKRKSSETGGGKKKSEGLERAPNSASTEARETGLGSSSFEKEVVEAPNSPDVVVFPKEKKRKQLAKERFAENPVLVKVEVDLAEPSSPRSLNNKIKVEADEPSVTKTLPIKLKPVKRDREQKRTLRPIICLPAPALSSGAKGRGKRAAESLQEVAEPLPRPATKETVIPAEEEVIVHEVPSSAPPGSAHTWRTPEVPKINADSGPGDEAPADPVLQDTDNWGSTGRDRETRGVLPNSVSENDSHSNQPPRRSVHERLGTNSKKNFLNSDKHANMDSRRPHWGNSYMAAPPPGPQNQFGGHEFNSIFSVLSRPNHYLGMQPNDGGNSQEDPQNIWQLPARVQTPPPRGHQFGGHQFSNVDRRQPPWTGQKSHPPRSKGNRSDSTSSPPHSTARQGHPGRHGHSKRLEHPARHGLPGRGGRPGRSIFSSQA